MTGVRTTGHRLLVLHLAGASYAVCATALAAIDGDGETARFPTDHLRDLDDLLPGGGESDRAPVRLIVHARDGWWGFRVRADLELVEATAIYGLPAVLRDAGCAPWVRGVALLGERDRGAPDDDRPTLWIDLARLASAG